MLLRKIRRGFLPAAVAGLCLLSSATHAANILVGTGPDTSYFVLESPNLGSRTYEISYTYDAMAMQDGFTLLNSLFGADSMLTADIVNYGPAMAPNYFVNAFTFNSVSEVAASSSPFVPYWAHWVSGGDAGFPSANPVASETWTEGFGISSPYRLIEPGSWDALVYSDGSMAPSVAPVPEPSAVLMVVAGSLVLLRRRSTN
jgi:hypothetical protein